MRSGVEGNIAGSLLAQSRVCRARLLTEACLLRERNVRKVQRGVRSVTAERALSQHQLRALTSPQTPTTTVQDDAVFQVTQHSRAQAVGNDRVTTLQRRSSGR